MGSVEAWQAVVTPSFLRRKKRASDALKRAIDMAARIVLMNPLVGEAKKGGLRGVRVYKFSYERLTYLLAYRVQTQTRQVQFLAVGPHENFYRNLQRRL